GITIDTGSLYLTDGAEINASTFGKGNAGAIDIIAADISLVGKSSYSSITSSVFSGAEGNSEGITINTNTLSVEDGGISTSTYGKGDGGAIDITATGDISVTRGVIGSQVVFGAEGNSGGIILEAGRLSLMDEGLITTSTVAKGDAGAIDITVIGDISVTGLFSSITSQVLSVAEGDSGGITINTNSLSLIDGAEINTSTYGQGDAGAISVTVTRDLFLMGEGAITTDAEILGGASRIASQVELGAEGSSGGITINTGSLSLLDGTSLSASTLGKGEAGAVKIQATDSVILQGQTNAGESSQILSQVAEGATGNANEISITTPQLTLLDGAMIAADTAGTGDARSIIINA
ncbi:MAG: filamentous hemagglutinin, partial [Prochlorotrichaceae cyanobacterium]